jgi:hypothetical protein
MKKLLTSFLVALAMVSGVFAEKAEPFMFNFSQDFYPGIGYVYLNSSIFKDAYFAKADILKNEYTIEKVSGSVALMPVWFTLKVSLQKDGKLAYEYSDLKYKKDNKGTGVTALFSKSLITGQFDKLLPVVFNDEAKYTETKSRFYSEPGMLYAMTNGLTEIRAAKFAEMVKDIPISIDAKVRDAKMNDSTDFTDYKYYISCSIYVGTLSHINFLYYTNDDDKASSAQGDIIKISGNINNFNQSSIFDGLSFTVVDVQ